MNCKHAVIGGEPALVNFRTKSGKVVLLIQEMDKPLQGLPIESLEISDYDSGTAILNGKDVLQMEPSDLAYAYARFMLVKR